MKSNLHCIETSAVYPTSDHDDDRDDDDDDGAGDETDSDYDPMENDIGPVKFGTPTCAGGLVPMSGKLTGKRGKRPRIRENIDPKDDEFEAEGDITGGSDDSDGDEEDELEAEGDATGGSDDSDEDEEDEVEAGGDVTGGSDDSDEDEEDELEAGGDVMGGSDDSGEDEEDELEAGGDITGGSANSDEESSPEVTVPTCSLQHLQDISSGSDDDFVDVTFEQLLPCLRRQRFSRKKATAHSGNYTENPRFLLYGLVNSRRGDIGICASAMTRERHHQKIICRLCRLVRIHDPDLLFTSIQVNKCSKFGLHIDK